MGFFYNSIGVNLPKNIIQYLLGVVLYLVIVGSFDVLMALLGLVGFVLIYSSVYVFNDLMDIEEDRKKKDKREWKIIATGKLSIEKAITIMFFLIVCGFFVSVLINTWFVVLMIALLALNILHSSTYTKFKKNMYKTSVNMTVIQFIKYSCGWFAVTTNISSFPFWVILAFSLVYNICYMAYKKDFKRAHIKMEKPVFAGMGLLFFVSYFYSMVAYSFPLVLLVIMVFVTIVSIVLKNSNIKIHSMKNRVFIEYVTLPIVILSFLLLMNPVVAGVNNEISDTLENYSDEITCSLPADVVDSLTAIKDNLEKYETLDDIKVDIENIINNRLTDSE